MAQWDPIHLGGIEGPCDPHEGSWVEAYLRQLPPPSNQLIPQMEREGRELCLPRVKEPEEILPTLTQGQVQALIGWKGRGWHQKRLHTLVLTLLDGGLRIEEALGLRRSDVDLDNLLLLIHGKGRKDRRIPIFLTLRQILYRWMKEPSLAEVPTAALAPSDLLFPTRQGATLGRRDVLRDFKRLCRSLGFEAPRRSLHSLRHTFGSGYIARGGSQFHLMKILGHTSLEMTKKYVHLQMEDLRQVHDGLSPLSPRR